MKFCILLCSLLTFSIVYSNINDYKNNLIFIIKKEGVYIYDHVKGIQEKIYSFKEGEMIENSSYYRIDNNIHFRIYDKNENLRDGIFYEKEYNYDLTHRKLSLFRNYKKTVKDSILIIAQTLFSEDGEIINTYEYKSALQQSPRGPFPVVSRTINNIRVVAKAGNLYLENLDDRVILLLKHRKNFSDASGKFPCGYISPDLSRNATKVIFIDFHATDEGDFKKIVNELVKKDQKTHLIELNIQTMKKTVHILDNSYGNPLYSFTNQLVLLIKSGGGIYEKEYYIYNLDNKELRKIPICYKAFWVY